MESGQALELYFDEVSERRLADVGFTVEEGLTIWDLGARPHISLAVLRPPAEKSILIGVTEELAQKVSSFSVHLSAVGMFPGTEGVVYLAPSVSTMLADVHALAHNMLQQTGLEADPLYQPWRWVPHCTIAMHVPSDRMGREAQRLRKIDIFGPVTLASVGVVSFRPVVDIAEYELK